MSTVFIVYSFDSNKSFETDCAKVDFVFSSYDSAIAYITKCQTEDGRHNFFVSEFDLID